MKAARLHRFDPDFAVPPGQTLREVMDSQGMTQRDLAARTGLTVQTLSRIIKGIQPISYETANRLEMVVGVPARLWNRLEAEYREQLSKQAERGRLRDGLDWLKTIPTRELIERGALSPQRDKVLLLRETLAFFGVSSVEAWHSIWDEPAVAARRSACFETRPGPAATWIRLGERQASEIDCRPHDAGRFKDALHEIRGLTREEPHVFVHRMRSLCADAGVALALVREMKQVPWNGATKWMSPSKAMILLNLRGKGEDRFWFSFFHEASHVLNDSKKCILINDESDVDPRERAANAFAAETLIPARHNDDIRSARTAFDLKRLARAIGVSVGVVAGRYQYLTKRWNYHRDLIRRLEWA